MKRIRNTTLATNLGVHRDRSGWRWAVFVGLAGLVGGCTTYVQAPPRTVVVTPPPVYVEPPRVYVPAPAPQYLPPPPPPPEVIEPGRTVVIRGEQDFYEPLSPYGRWVVVESYGRCWVPARVAADWRPYCNGRWERTEPGWYWASDEPWAWATYHYGRWDFHPVHGWFWVPQTQWAPAWVTWHHGGGYLGWAPMHPSVRARGEGAVVAEVGRVTPRAYVFVPEKRFLEPVRPNTVVVNNTTILHQTVNITNVRIVNQTVVNDGPGTRMVEQASGQTVRPVSAASIRHREEAALRSSKSEGRAPSGATVPGTGAGAGAGGRSSGEPAGSGPAPSDRRPGETPRVSSATPRPSSPEAARDRGAEHTRELHEKADAASQKNARDLERVAQRQSEQRAREFERKAQAESQKNSKDLERKAQAEAQQHARELQQQATEAAQRHANDLQQRAQQAAQERARELEKKAQAESQQAAREIERKAQAQAELRDRELHQRAQDNAQKAATSGPAAGSKKGSTLVPSRRPVPSRTSVSPEAKKENP